MAERGRGANRRTGIAGVAGNYDSTVATDYKHCGCRYEDARQEELHTSELCVDARARAPGHEAFLGGLPFRIDLRPLGGHLAGQRSCSSTAIRRSTPSTGTEDRSDDFLREDGGRRRARGRATSIAFGHTHKPWHRVVNGIHFVNTGSVGRPKDGDWRAGYVVLDVSEDR